MITEGRGFLSTYSGFLIANVILTGMQGTWQFMSAALVQDKNAPHTFVDDLESFLYVILWVSLMYSAHSIPSPDAHSLHAESTQGSGPV